MGAALQVSLGDSGVINLTCFPLLSVPVTAQNGFFSLSGLVANEGNYFPVLVPGMEKTNHHILFPAIFPDL